MVGRSEYFQFAADTVTALRHAGVAVRHGCAWLGIAPASYYRFLNPPARTGVVVAHKDRAYPNRLSPAEQDVIVDQMNSDDLANLSIRQAHLVLLDQGVYVCSLSTRHRVMRAHGQSSDRRRQQQHQPVGARTTPRLEATGPGQVWCWDITNLPGPGRCVFKLYSMLDLYSRYVVGYRVEQVEHQRFTQALFTTAFATQGHPPRVIHADNGGVMRAGTVRDLMASLHVDASYSRPRVSNDNPYVEALFKTVKYDLDYPDNFTDVEDARRWADEFFHRYNHGHHHVGLSGHTPARVHDGTWPQAHDQWVEAKAAYAANHPARHHQAPVTHTPPDTVWINKPNHQLSQTA